MKFIKRSMTAILLLLSLNTNAQKNESIYSNRLYVGDKVDLESIEFNNVRNYPGGKMKLSDFKGKFIILDFWTKGCSVCIASFPKMEELQNKFKHDIQVLLITKNSKEEILPLLKNSPNVKNTKLPIIIGDQILTKRLFPHGPVPYHVWLGRDGKVLATISMGETNVENLTKLTSGGSLNLLMRNESFDNETYEELKDEKKSLLKIGNGAFRKVLKYYAQIPIPKGVNTLPRSEITMLELPYYSAFMNFLPGYFPQGSTKFLRDQRGKEKGLRFYNETIDALYRFAYDAPREKVVLEDKAKSLYEEITDSTNLDRYKASNWYCYESSLNEYSIDNARNLLKQDLSRFFGMVGSVEYRPIKCLILTRLGTINDSKLWAKDQNTRKEDYQNQRTPEGLKIKNKPFQSFLTNLINANRASDDPLILNETGYRHGEFINKKIDILLRGSLHCTDDNIPLLRNELVRYGLGLKEEIRGVKVLVLRTIQ
ncbi:TlpA family protein disulfide reductase [Pedobacter ginsengisoli]|uniref:TlpA family protein disulfide reductase n=1 Tax=Pedobacter ginsengisoli TaxID=363852 RepID=UPI00254BB4DB|nr:TlpA disulfide reductase family protein [Pedobacter ginsengisoli]